MKDEYKQTLIAYRLEKSEESLKAAELLLKNNMLTSAMNRIYYSMFYSVQALFCYMMFHFLNILKLKDISIGNLLKTRFSQNNLVNYIIRLLIIGRNSIILI